MMMCLARMKESLFTRLIRFRRRMRQFVSRSEWVIRLLALTRSEDADHKPGLILIQIDGLSRTQFEKAMRAGRMPFMRQLLEEGHQLRSFYSGLPSTTPAVQGELLYGVRTIVPAFSYRDHTTHEIVSMLNTPAASEIEARLRDSETIRLLHDGSAYCDMYRGGAEKASFCSTSPGIDASWRRTNPLALLLAFGLHGVIVLRMIALFGIEIVLAVIDVVRGVLNRKNLIKELSFIPYRIIVCIFLRELATAGMILDIALGLPIVHCNFLGYDEQSHRRGPSSAFAHWTLKGIDGCLKRIWRFAQTTAQRDYDIWIYSDHGQEAAYPYDDAEDRTLETAVTEVFRQIEAQTSELSATVDTIQLKRFGWLGTDMLQRLWNSGDKSEHRPELTANGPVGHLYLPSALSFETRKKLGKALAEDAHVPVVMMCDEDDTILVWTPDKGPTVFPDGAADFLGADHPFLKEICADIPALVRHPDAGMFVLFGWGAGQTPLNFGNENGGHAGFGPEETHGFAVLAQDAPLSLEDREYLRPSDLRQTVLRFLGRAPDEPITAAPHIRQQPDSRFLRVMTYNVHSCVGMDGTASPQRIARVIAMYAPDIVALQEVDVNRSRTGGIDQAEQIAGLLNMSYHFHPSFTVAEEQYGNAVFSRFPMRVVKTATLPGKPRVEPRGALWVEITAPIDRPIQVVTTHLGLRRHERLAQLATLLGDGWLGDSVCQRSVIFCGDLNARPRSKEYAAVQRSLHDTDRRQPNSALPPTWMGVARMDYIFTSSDLLVQELRAPRTSLTRRASDHLPVIADFQLT